MSWLETDTVSQLVVIIEMQHDTRNYIICIHM